MTLFEPIEVALRVALLLDGLGIEFLVGGSVASSLHGVPRSTHDVDFVARVRRGDVDRIVRAFQAHYYIAREAVAEAVSHQSCFNLIDNKTMMKVDIFVASDDEFSRDEFKGLEWKAAGPGKLPVARPEHIVVEKLRWNKAGGGSSERQWNDVIGVLRVQASNLDLSRMRSMASLVGVTGELEAALSEVGLNA